MKLIDLLLLHGIQTSTKIKITYPKYLINTEVSLKELINNSKSSEWQVGGAPNILEKRLEGRIQLILELDAILLYHFQYKSYDTNARVKCKTVLYIACLDWHVAQKTLYVYCPVCAFNHNFTYVQSHSPIYLNK